MVMDVLPIPVMVVNLLLICTTIPLSISLVRFFLHRTGLIHSVRKWSDWIDDRVHVRQNLRVPEMNDSTQQENQLYHRVVLYLNSLPALEDSDYTNLLSGRKPNNIVLSLDDNQVIEDTFLGARLSWVNKIDEHRSRRSLLLRIKKKDKRRILKTYLQHIHAVGDEIEERGKVLRIFTHGGSNRKWNRPVPFDHPASFETLAMDADLKSRIKSELETFVKSRQYYHRLGRVWKRSYLLYGPSGTGKSSFIAAVANYLSFDVYNFNLSLVSDDADLHALLIQTSGKSLIVVEELDRYITEKLKGTKITSSGLMNFMDGILNFGDERIIIFTVNNKDEIDSSMLRPGRIDVHIHFPLCDFNSFKALASIYLGVKEHKLFPQLEETFQGGATMSAAEIGELMLVNRSSPSRALKSVLSALQSSGGKVAIASDSVASSPAPSSTAGESGGAAWKETAVPKEVRKLYGMLRMKSCRKVASFDDDAGAIQR